MRVLPDTNVWIAWLRAGAADLEVEEGGRLGVFLSTIALQELWAGARSRGVASVLSQLMDLAREHGRLLNPPAAAWIVSGQVLREILATRRVGGPRLRALRNDVLLAATAVSYDATVLTSNVKDFALVARFLDVRYRAPI